MPLDRLFRREAEEQRFETDFVREAIQTKMLELHQKLDVYATATWEALRDELQNEAVEANRVLMDIDASDHIALATARERAKTYARILSKPVRLEQELARLREQLREVEESEDG